MTQTTGRNGLAILVVAGVMVVTVLAVGSAVILPLRAELTHLQETKGSDAELAALMRNMLRRDLDRVSQSVKDLEHATEAEIGDLNERLIQLDRRQALLWDKLYGTPPPATRGRN